MRGQARQHGEGKRIALIPATDRTRTQTEFRKSHHTLGIKKANMSDAIAAWAGTDGIIEAEQTRLKLGQTVTADRTGIATGEQMLFVGIHVQRDHAALGER